MKELKNIAVLLLALALLSCKKQADVAREALEAKQVAVSMEEFVQAAREGNLENLRLFLQTGINVNAPDASGETAFGAAVNGKQKAAADLLLQHKADPSHPDAGGRTPLMLSAAAGETEWVKYLLAAGANDGLQDKTGRTALFIALEKKQKEVLPLLLRPSAALNLAAGDGRTPLGIAPDAATVNALLRAGAKPGREGIQGQPFIVWAVATKNHALVEELLESGVSVDTFASTPARNSFVATVGDSTLEYYLKRDNGVTPLMIAAGQGDLDMVRLLLSHGAKKFRETQKTGTAAIYIASTNRHTKVIQILLGKSPDQKYKIEISLARQRLTVFRDGDIWVRTPISTGAKGFETPQGEFVVTNKYKDWNSTIYDNSPMPFFMRLNCSAFGMHAGSLPGYPASHGCIRLPHGNAEKIFQQVPVGTVVTIVK
jgi:ankyrin repeat protein